MNEFTEQENEIVQAFKNAEKYYGEFDGIPAERFMHHRPDLNVFLLLDKLVSGEDDIIEYANRERIHLNVTLQDLVESDIDNVQIEDLVRSGLLYDDDDDVFYMNT